MVNYREILRLNNLGYSQRQIAASIQSSRDTISAVCKLAEQHGLEWPLPDELSNQAIQDIFYPERNKQTRRIPDYEYIHKELARAGVTLTLLWAEYTAVCHAEHAVPYQFSQFCEKYRAWARVTKATMRINRKPGDLMEVDWAGNTLTIYDSVTGDAIDVYLFVAVLPCSCYAYVEAFPDHGTENWLKAHIHAYQYFGGVTRILVPDNLKTGVIKNTRNELQLNRSYQEMAEYYDTAIIPARVKAAQDKPNVEGTVNHTSTWIIAALRNDKFFSIQELNEAVWDKLREFNAKPFQKREGSRLTAFQNEEKSFMKLLPASPYELAVWSTATVRNDYLITDGRNKYSVPFDLIGQEVSVRLTSTTVEAFFQGTRVASHPRLKKKQHTPIVKSEHMPDNHKKYLAYSKEQRKLSRMIMLEAAAPLLGVESMLNNPTVEKLREMKLKVMAQMVGDPDHSVRDLPFEERFGMMVEKEWLSRKNSKIKRLLAAASLGLNACLEDINYSPDRTIDKKTIQVLSSYSFIEQKLNIVISGKTGSGKTFLACALGNGACRQGYSVKYFRIPELLLEMQDAKQEKRYTKFMAQLQKIKLLILDDIGLKAYSLEESRDILEIVENRYNKVSTVLSGQIAHTKWYDLFPDPTLADAIMDRVIHNAYILALDSKKSMREVMAKTIKTDY